MKKTERKNWFMNYTNEELHHIKTDPFCKTHGDIQLKINHPEWFIDKRGTLHPSAIQLAYANYIKEGIAFIKNRMRNPKVKVPNFRSPYLDDRGVEEFLNELDAEIIFRWIQEHKS